MGKIAIDDSIDKIRGGLYGVAVGDALGATVEFMDKKAIQRKYGRHKDIIGGGWLNLTPGEWTDDTEMTLAVARGIIANPIHPIPHIGQAFILWKNTNPPDIGLTISTVFRIWERDNLTHEQWHEAAMRAHTEMNGMSAGNGALMRTLPVGIAYRSITDICHYAINIARMTHWDIKAGLTCVLYSLAVRNIINGEKDRFLAIVNATKALRKIILETIEEEIILETIEEDLREIEQYPIKKDGSNLIPTGYIVDSYICAVWAFIESGSFEETVVNAVNLGGDADTIGAIAGGLAGVYWGYKAIPKRWTNKFSPEQCKTLDEISEGLARLAGMKI